MTFTATLWCEPRDPQPTAGPLIYWSCYLPEESGPNDVSLPELVQQNREPLRDHYLRWLHKMSSNRVRGSSLCKHFLLRSNLSYWWMTVPASNPIAPNSPTYNLLRLIALQRHVEENDISTLCVSGNNLEVRKLLRHWSRDARVAVIFSPKEKKRDQTSSRRRLLRVRMAYWLPFADATLTLWRIGRQKKPEQPPSPHSQSGFHVIDYFAHLGSHAKAGEVFESNYWGPLVEVLESTGPVSWLHLSAENPRKARLDHDQKLMDLWHCPKDASHQLLFAGATVGVKMRAIRDYLRIATWGLLLRRKADLFMGPDDAFSYWQAFRRSWRDEWYGATAMKNCLYLNSFEAYLKTLRHDGPGIYLYENQPWELALISSWRRYTTEKLFAVPHSTVRYWDTRVLANLAEICRGSNPDSLPSPDVFATNGPVMARVFEQFGCSSGNVASVEALRFTRLAVEGVHSRSGDQPILVLGEYSQHQTDTILNQVIAATKGTSFHDRIRFRGHPALGQNLPAKYRGLQVDESATAVDAIRKASVVVCGSLSSSAVESMLLGKPTFLIPDAEVLTSSPAEALGPTWAIDLHQELRQALVGEVRTPDDAHPLSAQQYFFAGRSLARWKDLLGL